MKLPGFYHQCRTVMYVPETGNHLLFSVLRGVNPIYWIARQHH